MKDTNDELKLVIVRDMWLTGFDAPSMHTLYVDKKMHVSYRQSLPCLQTLFAVPQSGLQYPWQHLLICRDDQLRHQWLRFSFWLVQSALLLRYGNAKYLRDALPNASYIGFTGTPIEKEDKSTPAVFGGYIDIYDIKQSVDDGATVPISYESRLVKIKLDEQTTKKLDKEISNISDATEEQIEQAKKKTATIDAVVGHPDRLKDVAKDIVDHFEARQKVAVLWCGGVETIRGHQRSWSLPP
jgi:type I site-specific restriction-modification system R (restriction) subunit